MSRIHQRPNRRDDGQVIVMVALCLVAFIGMLGLVIDVGRIYVVQRDLQTAVDASALAAAQDLPSGDVAITTAVTYGGEAGRLNVIAGLPVTTPSVVLKCLSLKAAGVSCITGTGPVCSDAPGCNAVRVTQQVSVTPWFMRVFGIGSKTISATATASMGGGGARPLDAMVVVDTTGSMGDQCTAEVPGIPKGLQTKLDCAKSAVRALISELFPCDPTLPSCPAADSTHNVANAIDRIGMMIFPALKGASVNVAPDSSGVVVAETDCINNVGSSNNNNSDVTYTANPNYQVVPLSSDYRTSGTSGLNPDSPLVQAVWWKNCPGGVYPIAGGGGSSSIVGGQAGDLGTATNGSGIAGGPSGASDRSGASNDQGILGGPTLATNRSGANTIRDIAGGPGSAANRTTANNGPGITGGPTATGDRSSASTNGATSLAVARPGNSVPGDLVLVSVTARGDLTGSGNICWPATGWTRVGQTIQGSGATQITQASFWTVTDESPTYQFTFKSGACSGTSTSVAASAVAARYNGVDPANPIDAHAEASGAPQTGSAPSTNWTSTAATSTTTYSGSAPATNWTSTGPALTQTLNGSATASTSYGTAAHYVSGSTNCVNTLIATCDVAKFPQAGNVTGATFNLGAATTGTTGIAYTITLLKTQTTSLGTCTINQGLTAGNANCTITGLNAAVLTTETLEFRVVRAAGITSTTSAAVTTSITETYTGPGANNTNYVSLASSCTSTATATCNDATLAATGTLTNATLTLGANAPASNSFTVALMVNTVATGPTCTIAAGSNSCTIAGGGLALTAGQKVELQIVHTGSATLTTTATTTLNELVITTPAGADTNYVSLSTACVNIAVGPCNVTTVAAAGTLTNASVTFGANVPTGDTFSVTLMLNGIASASACNIAAGASTCNIPAGLALTAGDKVELKITRTGGSAAFATTATTILGGTLLTAPAVTTTVANDRVVRLFGTGSASFTGGSGLPLATSVSPASGMSDAAQATAGAAPAVTASSASAANWVAQTVALREIRSSISIDRPATRADADFLLVTVTAESLMGGSICAPNSEWTLIRQNTQAPGSSASVTQATFWSFRAGTNAETYTFTFHQGDCNSALLSAPASAVAVRYTGVDEVTPIDAEAGTNSGNGTANFSGSAPSTGWTTTTGSSPVTQNGGANSRTWTATARYVSLSTTCDTATLAGTCNNTSFAQAGNVTTATFTFSNATASNQTYTISLLKNANATPLGTCSIAANDSTPTCSITGTFGMIATDTLELRVVGTGSSSITSAATTSVTETVTATTGTDTHFISVSAACVNVAAGTCVTTATTAGTLTTASLTFGTAVPAGDTFTITLFLNGAATASTCTIAAAASTCSIPGGVALAANDTFELRVARTAGTTAFTATATTAATESYTLTNPGTTLTAPAVTTTVANDQVVSIYGTGAVAFSAGLPLTSSGSSSATGLNSTVQPVAGTTGTTSATSTTSGHWVAQTVALRHQQIDTTIVVARPATRADADFLLVSVTAVGNLTGSGSICAPDNTWTRIVQTTHGSGATQLTQATFGSVRAGAAAETYTFTFHAGACSDPAVAVAASGVAVRYTGVDPTTPTANSADAVAPSPNPGTTLTAPEVTTTRANTRIVRFYGTGATSISAGATFAMAGSASTTGVSDAAQPAAGPSGTATATSVLSAEWAAQTIALRDTRTSISIDRPATAVAGDFLLVSVTAEGLDTGNICAPNDGTWTLIRQDTQGAGAASITQATFRSLRVGTDPETYTFTFHSSACPGSGSFLSSAATAVAVRYTGVDPTNPIDGSNVSVGPGANPGLTATSPTVATTGANDRIVRFYGTGATSLSAVAFNEPGPDTATGTEDTAPATSTDTATSATSASWVGQTLALNVRTSLLVGRPANRSDSDFLLLSVTAKGLGATGNICATDDGTWTLVRQLIQGSGATSVTLATFWAVRGDTSDELYQFDLVNGSCSSPTSRIAASASAVIARYTGVNLLFPIDDEAGSTGSLTSNFSGSAGATNWTSTAATSTSNYNGSAPSTNWTSTAVTSTSNSNGSAPSTNWTSTAATSTTTYSGSAPATNWTSTGPALTQTLNGSATASTSYGTAAHYVSGSTNCVNTLIATCDVAKFPQAGNVTGATFNLGAATTGTTGIAYTITLLKTQTTSLGTCTINQGLTAGNANCTITGLNAAVLTTETLEFRVVRAAGITSTTSAAVTTSITETYTGPGANNTNYVSLASSCTSTATATCNDATLAATGTLTNATLTLGANAPASNSFTVALMVNTVATGPTCTIAAGSNSCTIAGGGLALTAGQKVELQIVHTGSATLTTTATTTLNELVITTPAGANTNYVSLASSSVGQSAGGVVAPNDALIATTGTLTSATFTLGTAVPAGNSYAVTLFDNGVATTSTCTIAATQTTCSVNNTGGALTAGHRIELQIVHTGATTLVTTATTTLNELVTITPAGANTNYVSLASSSVGQSAGGVVAPNDALIATTGTLTSATFTLGTAVPAGNSYAVTLFDNGVATTSTCTIAATQTTCSVNNTGGALTAGHRIELQIVHTGPAPHITTATTTLTELVTITPAGANTNYVSLSTACTSTVLATCNVTTVPTNGAAGVTLGNAALTFGANVPVGDTFVVTLFRNGVATASACTITAGNNTCTIVGGLALTAGDKLELRVVRTAGSVLFNPTATTSASVTGTLPNPGTTLTAPAVATTEANDQIIRLYGTGATSFSAGTTTTGAGSSSATGFSDANQAAIGSTGTATATTTSAGWATQTIALRESGPGCSNACWYGLENGSNTYYADAIAAAQAVLTGSGARPGTQRAIILLSDGDANANNVGADPCLAGINAAKSAETPLSDGSTTWIFAVSFNAINDANATCQRDTVPISGLCAMHLIAHNSVTDTALNVGTEGSVCNSTLSDPAHHFYNPTTDGELPQIFRSIGQSLATTRLVSNDAT